MEHIPQSKLVENFDRYSDEQKLIRYFLEFHKPNEEITRYDNESFVEEKRENFKQSLAEHLAGMHALAEHLDEEGLFEVDIDMSAVRKIITYHDQPEVHLDDVTFKTPEYQLKEVEVSAKIAENLRAIGKDTSADLLEKYEEQNTPEARLVKAIDRLEAYLTMMYAEAKRAPSRAKRIEADIQILENVRDICPTLVDAGLLAIRFLNQHAEMPDNKREQIKSYLIANKERRLDLK